MADAVLGDFIGDAAAWADYLAGEGFRRVVLIGHSEGALIAFCAALVLLGLLPGTAIHWLGLLAARWF